MSRKHEFAADTNKALLLGEDVDEEEERKMKDHGKDIYNSYLSWWVQTMFGGSSVK